MTHIEPYQLWLGHAGDGRDVVAIVDNQIQAVVQLAVDEPPLTLPRELIYLRVPLHDDPSNDRLRLQVAVDSVAMLLRGDFSTLVCCSGGASRSPAVAACALSLLGNRSPADCLLTIHEQRGTDISPGLWQALLAMTSNRKAE